MNARRRDRPRKLGRRPPFRPPKPIILIVCEGEKTEPQYFEGFKRFCRNPRVDIAIAPEHGAPIRLVEYARDRLKETRAAARRERDQNLEYDAVWCVFDVDQHAGVGEARQMAIDNAIYVAISNPLLELWLLLHFRDNPGMQSGQKIYELLREHVPDYDKGVDFPKYAVGYGEAVIRARRMDDAAHQVNESGRNPTTGVYRLTESIANDPTA